MEHKLKRPIHEGLQLIALGANLPSNGATLQHTLVEAVQAIARTGFSIRAVSRFFQTPCFPVGAGPDYVNAALAVRSPWDPAQSLAQLHAIEADFGRERVQRWGQRTLDLDLIAVSDMILPDATVFGAWHALDPALQAKAAPDCLILPHPRLQDRAFVLAPLADIAPDWRHPVLGQSVSAMLSRLPPYDIASATPI